MEDENLNLNISYAYNLFFDLDKRSEAAVFCQERINDHDLFGALYYYNLFSAGIRRDVYGEIYSLYLKVYLESSHKFIKGYAANMLGYLLTSVNDQPPVDDFYTPKQWYQIATDHENIFGYVNMAHHLLEEDDEEQEKMALNYLLLAAEKKNLTAIGKLIYWTLDPSNCSHKKKRILKEYKKKYQDVDQLLNWGLESNSLKADPFLLDVVQNSMVEEQIPWKTQYHIYWPDYTLKISKKYDNGLEQKRFPLAFKRQVLVIMMIYKYRHKSKYTHILTFYKVIALNIINFLATLWMKQHDQIIIDRQRFDLEKGIYNKNCQWDIFVNDTKKTTIF